LDGVPNVGPLVRKPELRPSLTPYWIEVVDFHEGAATLAHETNEAVERENLNAVSTWFENATQTRVGD
jgi:hypothetical protein